MKNGTEDFPSVEPRILSKEELERIDAIEFGYAYDFAPLGPNFFGQGKRERWSLSKLVHKQDFPFAALDIVDKLGIEALDIDGFYEHVKLDRIHLPGEISAITAAKTIKYCLEILACEFNYKLHSWYDGAHKRLKIADLAADKLIREVRRQAKEWQEGDVVDSINIYAHFVGAVRHPVINQAVYNAAVNRWGLSKDTHTGAGPLRESRT
jgi:hypothetical protein